MSLSDELDGLATKPGNTASKCAFVKALDSDQVTDEDRSKIENLLWDRNEGPDRVTNRDITLALRRNGIQVAFTATDRHRKHDCACFNLS